MNLARASVSKPVFTSMVTLIVLVLGTVSLSRLQIDLLPSIELPTLTVRTQYEGADPIVMERLVTQIVEEIIATVPGVVEMTSSSYEGNSRVRVTFAWGSDIDSVAVDVQATLEDEVSELPDDIVGPRVSKFDVDSFPVVLLGISSRLDPVVLTQLVEDQVRYRFARIPGVAQVDPWGGFTREVRVELDSTRVNALGLSLNDILDALENANLDLPAGKIERGRYEVTLRAPAEFADLDQIRATVIGKREGAVVTLGQVAKVADTYEKLTSMIRVNGERGLRVAIRKQAGANTVDVAQQVLAEIDAINQAFSQIHVAPVINQGNFIERSIANVAQSVLYGGALAVLVLLFFLRNLRSTLVISLAIPISVVATFALLYFGGFTLNLMTLGGLALGVGMMVDSSVVVLENIYRRHRELGETPRAAAVAGTGEVAGAVTAGTITTLTIFLPLVFVRGVPGVLFQELAYVIMFSLLCSLLVALGLVPMLASRFLSAQDTQTGRGWTGRLAARAGTWFTAMEDGYRDLLAVTLRHRWLTVGGSAAILAASLLLIPSIGTEFMPPSDEGEVRVTGEMEVGTRLALIDRQSRQMEAIVMAAVPEAVSSVVSVSTSGNRGSAKAQSEIRLSLTPATQRTRSNAEIADDLRQRLEGRIPGMTIRTRAPQGQFLLERLLAGTEGITVEVRGFDLDTLALLARRVSEAIADVPGVTDVDISRETGIPQQQIQVQRDKIADLGLTVRDITEVIETAVAGSKAGEFRSQGNSYRILVQLENAEQRSIDEILDLTLRTPAGEQVALRNLVTTESARGPVIVERKDQQRLVTVTANVADRDLGSVANDVRARLGAIPRPIGYDLNIAGNYQEQEKAFQELTLSLLLALVLVYMVLASQYESLRDPLVVMLSVPMATVGVVLTLFLTDTTLNLQSAIGCIMLCGIAVNNAILLVDQAGRLRREGLPMQEALSEAGRRRLRPILMTTLTTVLALLPLAFGIGEGADAQAPLARAVLGGLTASTLITLVLIPAVYSLINAHHVESVPGLPPQAPSRPTG
ncbi:MULTISPECIES: efflux RND transporter permease subunit [Thiorhodovibrio]|uniref:efflux RND transporter permease subunit n=1 Tax=Thiorhodovibrio TaxID=61593 RepID=UPI00191200F7|nr:MULTISPECIES: efflux RND transporter permease subunit [Thiorhodovibrio]MBK5969292.1 acriflavin resistance protein [Thiorhodovibrio winogradskyi]WPL11716.1 Cation efflux system protein CzcA [Thiorhodovibrio litoralis]